MVLLRLMPRLLLTVLLRPTLLLQQQAQPQPTRQPALM
jgi:hypothetical protein